MRFVDTSRVRTRFDERVVARDGTELSVDLYLPSEQGEFPVLLTRTPYDNNRVERDSSGTKLLPSPADRFKKLAANGFIVAAGDVRGRGDSDGEFVPFVNEATDGADTVEWARGLDGSNGRVGMFGRGYEGFCIWAALADGARLDAIFCVSPFGAEAKGLPFRGGALRLDWLFWMHLVGGRTVQKVDVPDWKEIWHHLPVSDLDEVLGRRDIWWKHWLEEPDELREALDLDARLRGTAIPALHVTGWWDQNLPAARAYWDATRSSSSPQHHLVIGPWDTGAVRAPRADVGGIEWGPRSVVDLDELLLDWFGAAIGAGEGAEARPTAQVFVTGRNEWLDLSDWPPETAERRLWLSSGGNANTRRGDGRLLDEQSDQGVADGFTYNPEHPVSWQANFTTFSADAGSPLSLAEEHATGRDDVLCYVTQPFEESLTLLGVPRLELYAVTSALDTDWVASISDVFPLGGRSVHLGHAIVRAGAQASFAPGETIRYVLEFDDLGHEFLPGHSLRLSITSSLFPLYARNLGSGEPYVHARQARLAYQRVRHGAEYPSRLLLPVFSGAAETF